MGAGALLLLLLLSALPLLLVGVLLLPLLALLPLPLLALVVVVTDMLPSRWNDTVSSCCAMQDWRVASRGCVWETGSVGDVETGLGSITAAQAMATLACRHKGDQAADSGWQPLTACQCMQDSRQGQLKGTPLCRCGGA